MRAQIPTSTYKLEYIIFPWNQVDLHDCNGRIRNRIARISRLCSRRKTCGTIYSKRIFLELMSPLAVSS